MFNKSLHLFILFLLSFEIFSQCNPPFIEADCYGGMDMNIRQAFLWTHQRHYQQWGLDNSYTLKRYESRMSSFEDPVIENKIDSVFSETKQYLIGQLGEEIFCNKVSIYDEGFKFSKGRKDKLLTGKITFYYYFEDIKCWYGKSEKIEFSFEENLDGLIHIKYPEELPNCKDEDCQYDFNSFTDVIRKGIQDDVLDARFNLGTERYHNKIEINYSPMPFHTRWVTFDNKDGQLLKDTTSSFRKNPNWLVANSFEQTINKAGGIIDATCIEKVKFEKNNLTYDRYLYDVHYVLKGDSISNFITIDSYQGMHSNFTSKIGQRRLLILHQRSKDHYKLKTIQNDYQQWQSALPIDIISYPNVYSEIYSYVLNISNEKLRTGNSVNYTNGEIIDWLKSNGKEELKNKDGLIIGLASSHWSKDNSSIFTKVNLASTKDFTYLTYKEFEISYDTTFIGSYGVKNNRISIDPYFSHSSHGGDRIPQTILGELYEINLIDIEPNKLKVILKPKTTDKLGQINTLHSNRYVRRNNYPNGMSKKFRYANSSFIRLEFAPKENVKKNLFEVSLEVDSFDIKDKHFDYHNNQEKEYSYQFIYNEKSQLETNQKNLTIDSVNPLAYKVGDTITVYGTNLNAHLDRIRFPCKSQNKDIPVLRYGGISEHQIIESSFHKLVFRVPEYFNYNKDGLNKMFPTSGFLKIKYSLSKEPLELIE